MSPKKSNHEEKEEAITTTEHHETSAEAFEEISEKAEKVMNNAADKIEDVMDTYANKVTKTVESKIDPEVSKKAKQVAWKVESVADSIEDTVNDLAWFIPHVSNNNWKESSFSVHANYSEKVSRLFIFRRLWLIVQLPISYIRSIRFGVTRILQVLHMLILGKRNKTLRTKNLRYMSHMNKRYSYLLGLTDKEPKIIED